MGLAGPIGRLAPVVAWLFAAIFVNLKKEENTFFAMSLFEIDRELKACEEVEFAPR
jgi:hypothetical protein